MQSPKEIRSDNGLARAGCQREQHAGRLPFVLVFDDLFESRPNGGVLIVTKLGIGGTVRLEKDGSGSVIKIDPGVAMIAICQAGVIRKVREWEWPGLFSSKL